MCLHDPVVHGEYLCSFEILSGGLMAQHPFNLTFILHAVECVHEVLGGLHGHHLPDAVLEVDLHIWLTLVKQHPAA